MSDQWCQHIYFDRRDVVSGYRRPTDCYFKERLYFHGEKGKFSVQSYWNFCPQCGVERPDNLSPEKKPENEDLKELNYRWITWGPRCPEHKTALRTKSLICNYGKHRPKKVEIGRIRNEVD